MDTFCLPYRYFRTAVVLLMGVLALQTARADKIRWIPYKSNLLNLQVSVPGDWKPIKVPKALAFRYDDLAGGTAGIGILKSDQTGIKIEDAADREAEQEGHPADWVRAPATVGGMRAIKIVGTSPKNPGRKMVHYYIDTPQGIYLIQCQAAQERWSTFSPIFATVLRSVKFLP